MQFLHFKVDFSSFFSRCLQPLSNGLIENNYQSLKCVSSGSPLYVVVLGCGSVLTTNTLKNFNIP